MSSPSPTSSLCASVQTSTQRPAISARSSRTRSASSPGDSRFPQGVHYDYDVDTTVAALWTELEWALSDDVRILAGLRAESHDYDYTTKAPPGINGRFNVPADRSDSYEFVTPKLGAVWSVSDTVDLYANYARGARAPQVSDLYRLQSLQVVAQVDTETLDSVELGARGAALDGRLVFDVAAYWMDKENYFFATPTA